MFEELVERLDALEARVDNMVRVGHVVGIDEGRGTVRVRFGDADGTISYDLPVLFPKTHHDQCLHMPDLDEHVICVFLPNGQQEGFVLGAFYSASDVVPLPSRDKRRIDFKDGSWFEYDRAAHQLSGHVEGGSARLTVDREAILEAGEAIRATAPVIHLMGNVSQTGRDGGMGTEEKATATTHIGSYRLIGPLHVSSLTVDGDAQINGDCFASTRSGGAI